MAVYYKPKTVLGKWSIGLFVGAIVFLSVWRLQIRIVGMSFINLIPVAMSLISGISSFFTGIIGIVKSKERSVIVITSTIIGFIIIGFIILLIFVILAEYDSWL